MWEMTNFNHVHIERETTQLEVELGHLTIAICFAFAETESCLSYFD